MNTSRLIDTESGEYISNGNQLTYSVAGNIENLDRVPRKGCCFFFKYGLNTVLFLFSVVLFAAGLYEYFQKNFPTDTNYFSYFRLFMLCCMLHSLTRLFLGYSIFRIYNYRAKIIWSSSFLLLMLEMGMIYGSLYVFKNFQNTLYFNTYLWKITELYLGLQLVVAFIYLFLLITSFCC